MPGFDPAVSPDPAASAYAFVDGRMFVHAAPEARVPTLSDLEGCGPVAAGPFPLGGAGELAAVAVSLPADAECSGLELKGLRELFGLLSDREMETAARAFQVLE